MHFDTLHRLTRKVGQQQLQTAPPHLNADAVSALRIERQRHRGLADLAAHPVLFQQQTVVEQTAHDDGHRLGGQLGQARQIGLGYGAVMANGLQHNALIELAHAHMVGAPHGGCGMGGVHVRWGEVTGSKIRKR